MNLFTFIKSRLSITDVIGAHVALKKAGLYFKGSCPFHSEKTASFTVSPHKEIFYCFGCHASGDLIGFISKIEHCSQIEAAQHLIERYSIAVPAELETKPSHSHEAKKRYHELCKLVSDWCVQQLEKNKEAKQYFIDRGFDQKTLTRFSIGYFPGGHQAMRNLVQQVGTHNYMIADLLAAHIVEQGTRVLYSPFQERLIFPIKDLMGNFCGFGGRIFKAHDERAKYYNSRENEFFNKGSLLFGFDAARKAMHEQEAAFLVEGYTDCMAMAQHGFENTVATLGTACTIEHLKTLARHTSTVYVVYDGDNAGQQAMLRLAELCWEVNLELKIVHLPADQDPASLLKTQDLKPYLENAQDIFAFAITTISSSFANLPLGEKLKNASKILELIARVEHPLKQDILLQQAVQQTAIPFTSLKQELARIKQSPRSTPKQQSSPALDTKTLPTPPALSLEGITLLEKKLISATLTDARYLHQIHHEGFVKNLHPDVRALLEKCITIKETHHVETYADFLHHLDEREQQMAANILSDQTYEMHESFESLLEQMQRMEWRRSLQELKQKIMQAEANKDSVRVRELLHEGDELKKRLMRGNL